MSRTETETIRLGAEEVVVRAAGATPAARWSPSR